MRLPALAPHPLPTLGLGSLHDIIVRFGVHEVLGCFLHRGRRTRACTNCTCARAAADAAGAASSFGRWRRWALARPRAGGGGGTGVGGGGRGRGVARTCPPSTPRLLLLSVRAFTDALRQTQLLEVHGVLEDDHPPRVHRILHIRVFER